MALRQARPPFARPTRGYRITISRAASRLRLDGGNGNLVTQTVCPLCRGGRTEPILRLDGTPVHQHVTGATADDARSMPRGDVTLALCLSCGFVFNSAFDPERVRYSQRVRELAGPLRRVQRVSRRPHNRTHDASSARREDHCRDRLRPGPFSRAVDGEGALYRRRVRSDVRSEPARGKWECHVLSGDLRSLRSASVRTRGIRSPRDRAHFESSAIDGRYPTRGIARRRDGVA